MTIAWAMMGSAVGVNVGYVAVRDRFAVWWSGWCDWWVRYRNEILRPVVLFLNKMSAELVGSETTFTFRIGDIYT